eukprot:TRINITY_DN6184_c0_g2_i1.p1 TRINITY_DN6184_c0_g2~~TRINITY_DN6184_c0_g2_i1.p1  ORF type:complete len:543 (-),score=68.16 TRINITY_DN6184_c0_g2_i1:118-1746(-)
MYVDYLTERDTSGGGLSKMYYNYGDWVPPPPTPMCNSHLTASFAYIASTMQVAEIAKALGNTTDYEHYSGLAASLSKEFTSAFYSTSNGFYDSGLQTAQVLPFWLGAVPSGDQAIALENYLLNDIVVTHKGHLSTGIVGTKFLFEVLDQLGRTDLALQLAENFDYPSFGYMAVNNIEPATTFWELWDTPAEGPGMNSRNHIMFGSVGAWFYKTLAGIKTGDAYGAGGLRSVTFAPPNVLSGLSQVSASFNTLNGQVETSWKRTGGSVICGQAAENYALELSCASIGAPSGSVISSISFASYGTPSGHCNRYGYQSSCHLNITQFVSRLCVGKPSCSFNASLSTFGNDPCFDTFKRAYVQAVCSLPTKPALSLNVVVPVGSVSTVVLPRLEMSNIVVAESGTVIYRNGAFLSNVVDGVSFGSVSATNLVFNTSSGSYSFTASGAPPTYACTPGHVAENTPAKLACTDPSQTITYVSFASYGTPIGGCGSFFVQDCHAGSSVAVVERACLGKNSCTFTVGDPTFGDPCYGTVKSFVAQVACTSA